MPTQPLDYKGRSVPIEKPIEVAKVEEDGNAAVIVVVVLVCFVLLVAAGVGGFFFRKWFLKRQIRKTIIHPINTTTELGNMNQTGAVSHP